MSDQPTRPRANELPQQPIQDSQLVQDRRYMEALNKLFNRFAVEDQRVYYEYAIERNRRAGSQVSLIRAFTAFVAGFAAALTALLVQSVFVPGAQCTMDTAGISYCDTMKFLVSLTTLIAVIAPAIGSAFNGLSDLYQWDRQVGMFTSALESLVVADAYSPDSEEADTYYRASLSAFAQGTLEVMESETAQWGQLVRTPEQIEKFLAESLARQQQVINAAAEQRFSPPQG
ncbi:MAG TPA: hypothetical protein PLD47_04570 [Aggregatilineales bacterium]|nr:hypothetical protein [Anaerolineales bacterium]HRE46977.1 hypothetical protein [Aggregatilineales bacterium]